MSPPGRGLTEFQAYLLQGLTDEQRAAVTEPPDASMLIAAGAGTGKTRTLIARCAWLATLGVDLERLLLVTFTNHAAREVRERLGRLFLGERASDPEARASVRLPETGTFHGVAARWLRRNAEAVQDTLGRPLTPRFTIMDERDSLQAIKEAALTRIAEGSRKALELEHAKVLRDALDLHSNSDPDPANLVQRLDEEEVTVCFRLPRSSDLEEVAAGRIVEAYGEWKERCGSLDYNDLISIPVMAMRADPTLAPDLEGILVDEYQDTDTLQEEFLQLMRGGAGRMRDPCPICCVGDDAQLLYAWRGAEISNILGMPGRVGCQAHKLTLNWRSPQGILDVGNMALAGNLLQHPKTLRASPTHPGGAPGPVAVHVFRDPSQEADWIAGGIQADIAAGGSPSAHAVLARTARALTSVDGRLARMGIPYRVTAGRQFAQRADVRNAGAWLRLLLNPADETACERALTNPRRGLGPESLRRLSEASAGSGRPMIDLLPGMAESGELKGKAALGAASGHEAYRRLAALADRRRSPLEIMTAVLDETGVLAKIREDLDSPDPDVRETGRERQERVSQLQDLAADHSTLAGLSEHLSVADAPADAGAPECVTLSTVHAAKGAEWPSVWVIGMEEGILPVGSERSGPGSLEEERRILHVAATRAQRALSLSRCLERRGSPSEPSRFLAELGPSVVEADHSQDGGAPGARAA